MKHTFRFTSDDYEYGQVIKSICETFENRFFLEEVKIFKKIFSIERNFKILFFFIKMFDFFYSHPNVGSSIFARQQAIDVVENNIFWIFDRETDVANNLLGPFKKFKCLTA